MKRITLLVAAAMLAATVLAAGAAYAHPGHGDDDREEGTAKKKSLSHQTKKKLAKVRQATARYHDVKKALADGYVAT